MDVEKPDMSKQIFQIQKEVKKRIVKNHSRKRPTSHGRDNASSLSNSSGSDEEANLCLMVDHDFFDNEVS